MVIDTKMNQTLELSDRDCEALVTKMLPQSISYSLEANEKIKTSRGKKKRSYKKESNGNYRTEKYINRNKKYSLNRLNGRDDKGQNQDS